MCNDWYCFLCVFPCIMCSRFFTLQWIFTFINELVLFLFFSLFFIFCRLNHLDHAPSLLCLPTKGPLQHLFWIHKTKLQDLLDARTTRCTALKTIRVGAFATCHHFHFLHRILALWCLRRQIVGLFRKRHILQIVTYVQ